MKSECCHQHPDNGSDLALQTESQRAKTDLHAINAQLLEALDNYLDWTLANRGSEHEFFICKTDVNIHHPVLEAAREAIEEARK